MPYRLAIEVYDDDSEIVRSVYEFDDLAEASRLAMFLDGIVLRMPPIDTDKVWDQELING